MTGRADVTYIRPRTAAARLAVSLKAIRRWLRSGRLAGLQLGKLWRVEWPARFSRGRMGTDVPVPDSKARVARASSPPCRTKRPRKRSLRTPSS